MVVFIVLPLTQVMKTRSYTIDWNEGNYASGIYLYVLQAEEILMKKKMMLIK